MWGGTDDKQTIEALHAACDLGITSIDTAPVYGGGHSEIVVGKAIAGRRDKVQVLTKFGLTWEEKKGQFSFTTLTPEGKSFDIYKYAAKDQVIKECEASLKRLGTDYIDLYQIHWPDPTTPIDETMEAVNKLLKDGKIRAFGVWNFSKPQLQEATKYGEVVSDQVPFSMVNRDIEEELLPYCINNKKAVLVYSPLQRGLLTGKVGPDYTFKPTDHRRDNPFFSQENREKINQFLYKITPLGEHWGLSLPQLVLAWTLAQPGITAALVGARNVAQVEENAGAVSVALGRDEIDKIDCLLVPTLSQLVL